MLNEHQLNLLGWNSRWESLFTTAITNEPDSNRRPGRILSQEKDRYRIALDLQTTVWGTVRGKMIYDSADARDFPVVGDWVICRLTSATEQVQIDGILERKSLLARNAPGGAGVQPIAANVDRALIATSLNHDLNFARLDRYLTLVWDAGAVPVIVLTKRDLAGESWLSKQATVETHFSGVDVRAVSATEPETYEDLGKLIGAGQTAVVVGSSGVGKSTLINALVGKEVLKTQGIRLDDDKGRHTTTSRSLWQMPNGGLIIDTPGMRELQLLDSSEGLERAFEDVVSYFANCRFRDCIHESEPGCGIREALLSGELTQERWESFLKLQREVAFQVRKTDKAAQAEEKKKWKKIHMAQRKRTQI